MKTSLRAAGLFAVLASSLPMVSAASTDTPPSAVATFRIGPDKTSLSITDDLQRDGRYCRLSMAIDRVQVSSDSSALLVTANGYVPISALENCGQQSVKVMSTPARSGMLVDVSVKHGLYIALTPVSTQPMSFVATVARLGSGRNLVALPGAFLPGASLARQQQAAFSFSEDGPPPRIARDGRYVSVNGDIDCGPDAYPGVWDLLEKRKVVIPGARRFRDAECLALFGVDR